MNPAGCSEAWKERDAVAFGAIKSMHTGPRPLNQFGRVVENRRGIGQVSGDDHRLAHLIFALSGASRFMRQSS